MRKYSGFIGVVSADVFIFIFGFFALLNLYNLIQFITMDMQSSDMGLAGLGFIVFPVVILCCIGLIWIMLLIRAKLLKGMIPHAVKYILVFCALAPFFYFFLILLKILYAVLILKL